MKVLDDGVCDDGEEGEDDGTEEPDVDDLEVGGLGEAVAGLREERGEDEQGCEGHHDSVLEVKPLEEERGEGDDVDERRGDEHRHYLREHRDLLTD